MGALHVSAQETVVYSEGFEENNGGYTLQSGTTAGWEWGSPSGSVGPGTANSGAKCWGTVLGGAIPRPSEGSIVSTPIQLPTLASNQVMRVRFWAFVAIDGMYDRAEFLVSKDGTSWQSMMQMYQAMDSAGSTPAWRKYEIALDPSYSGQSVYLRFRGAIRNTNPVFNCGGSTDLSGFYVDDVAITVYTRTGAEKLFGLRAWEDGSTWASCPWVAPWTGEAFEAENDIYPVARGEANEVTDFYLLRKAPVEVLGRYQIQIQEKDSEDSFTDYVSLVQVDHASDTAVAVNELGMLSAYKPAAVKTPKSAVTEQGADVLGALVTADGNGAALYSGDTVELDFSNADLARGAVLVLGVKGFIFGTGTPLPYVGPPAIVVETKNGAQEWQARGRFLPRFEYSVQAFDLSGFLAPANPKVRLRSISHSVKYHLVDYAAVYDNAQPAFSVTQAGPVAAAFGKADLLAKLQNPDGNNVKLSGGESLSLAFDAAPQAPGTTRDFVFVSKGYYLPKSGSYLVYTWDGSGWALRDSFTFPSSLATRQFDLSLFLPDSEGEYKVRVWQDYQYEPAGIDHVSLSVDGASATLSSAYDYRNSRSIMTEVSAADGLKIEWNGCPRNRITQYGFATSSTNLPPVATPKITGTTPFSIEWAYTDPNNDEQRQVEIQVWVGPNATGKILWNPPVFTGTETSVTYVGPPIIGSAFARIRAFDGTDWGPWKEVKIQGVAGDCASQLTLQVYPVETNTLRVRQTGLFYQTVAVTNTCTNVITGLRLVLGSVPAEVQVHNAAWTSNGVPFLFFNGSLAAGEGMEFAIEYFVPNRQVIPNPVFAVEAVDPTPPVTPTGTPLAIDRALLLTNGTFLVEFTTETNKTYTIEYSGDMTEWKPAVPSLPGNGTRIQWLDSGPPKTESQPASQAARYYRLLRQP